MRYAVFFQGCKHYCDGCHNKESWDENEGYEKPIQDIIDDIKTRKYFIEGISISGGEPLLQYDKLLTLCKEFKKQLNKSIYVWTGYEMEYIKKHYPELLSYADEIFDGKFEINNPTKKMYRGSNNQQRWKKEGNTWGIID